MAVETQALRRSGRLGNLALFLSGVIVGALGLHFSAARFGDPLPPARLEATIFLPLVDNAGHRFSEDRWLGVLGYFADEFGGATLGHEQEGCWRDAAGQLRREPIRPITVSFEPRRLERFRKTVDAAGRRLGQEAVYIRFERPHVEVRRIQADGAETER